MTFTPSTVIGPDVSFYQDANTTPQQIDFNQMRTAGANFVIIRAGQNAWVDPDFGYNWKAAKAAGLPRGAYWFYDSRVTPGSQAKLFTSLIASDLPECGAWLDLEESYGGTYKGWQNWRLCLEQLRMNLPRVGIYTAPYYWMSNRPTSDEALSFFKSFELWIAHYNVISPMIPSPWTWAVFWQYGTPPLGKQYGCESIEIDMNYFNGDENYFRNYFDLNTVPTQPEGDGMYQGKAGSLGAKLWSTYTGGILSNQIATIPAGTTVQGASPVNGVVRLTSPQAGYTKYSMLEGYAEVIAPPPSPPPVVVKTPFTLSVQGYKPYSGELEKA